VFLLKPGYEIQNLKAYCSEQRASHILKMFDQTFFMFFSEIKQIGFDFFLISTQIFWQRQTLLRALKN